MLRTRTLRPRWLTVALVLWAAVWLSLPAPATGAPLPPTRASAGDGASDVLARLTPAERAELAQRAGELGAGGDPSLLLIIGIVLLVAILLYLPMAGRMQGWWR
jgi:hypothetical protein